VRQIKKEGGLINFLSTKIEFDQILAPHFYPNRYVWNKRRENKLTNSGALGKLLAKINGAFVSNHPTHSFVGYGNNVVPILQMHDETKSCFFPISELSNSKDFSMLLLGCVNSSPGFSTVHATQYQLGLSQRHLLRFLLRWDYVKNGTKKTKQAIEFPGCSKSFDKFYRFYSENDNLISGQWGKASFLFVKSARKAIKTEHEILQTEPRFVNCNKLLCPSCNLRLY
jgi:aminoglycoside N3'-acetyltransferase